MNGWVKVVNVLMHDLPAHVGCDPNHQRSRDRTTALFIAAGQGHVDVVSVLVAANADVTTADSKSLTPLHVAANQGHCHIARILLDAGADVNAADVKQLTPLHSAAWNGRSKIPLNNRALSNRESTREH